MKKVMVCVAMVIGIALAMTGCGAGSDGRKDYPELTEEQNSIVRAINEETNEPRVYHDKEHGIKVTVCDGIYSIKD